ncbi:MAG: hypothetical protein ABIM50_10930 [Novosphingobium sp.]
MPDPKQFLNLPGFHRRIVVEARRGVVAAMLEDDIHCLAVVLRHDGVQVTSIEPQFDRLPWDTCPGAQAKLVETFAGIPLTEVTARRDKKQNCTHFHDMAVLAASHAGEQGRVVYDLLATDPIEGERLLEIRRNGALLHSWREQDGVLCTPADLAGKTLFTLRDWIGGLTGQRQEAARLLQWGAIVAHGRTMPMESQSEASEIPPNCYTFQPHRAKHAVRNGERRDFSLDSQQPLSGFGDKVLARL